MEPEISTRCSECGAAVRPHTLFCPECGQPADKHGLDQADGAGGGSTVPEHDDEIAPEITEPDSPTVAPVLAETNDESADEPEPVAGDTDDPPVIEATGDGEETEQAKDLLSDHLEKLKTESEAAPGAIVMKPSRKELKRKSSSSKPKKSKGRLIWSRFGSLRRSDTPRPGRIEPGLRFLIVAAVLVAFAVAAYYFSRYLR